VCKRASGVNHNCRDYDSERGKQRKAEESRGQLRQSNTVY
jgi:hypothetical protein